MLSFPWYPMDWGFTMVNDASWITFNHLWSDQKNLWPFHNNISSAFTYYQSVIAPRPLLGMVREILYSNLQMVPCWQIQMSWACWCTRPCCPSWSRCLDYGRGKWKLHWQPEKSPWAKKYFRSYYRMLFVFCFEK